MTDYIAFTKFIKNPVNPLNQPYKTGLVSSSINRFRSLSPCAFWSVFAMTFGLLIQTSSAAGQNDQPVAVSLEQCRKLAEEGNVEALYKMGTMYETRLGEAQDFKEAAKWYLKAAEKGNAKAQYKLGTMYTLGKGVRQDHIEAARWFGKAAQQGYEPFKRQIQERGAKLKDQLLKDPLGMFQQKPGG
jgi:hypothetical protein